MGIATRQADLDKDRRILIDLMLRYLTPRSDERKFDWLYRENPDGPAKIWLAIDTDRDEIVGSGAVIPRRMYLDGNEQLGCLLADFWIHPQYRSLGPATQLQRACIEDFRAGRFSLCYDFPQSSMGAVYKRLGILPKERLLRMTKPLRVDNKVTEIVPIRLLRPTLTTLGNRWLALRDHTSRRLGKCTVSFYEGMFGEEFSAIAHRASAQYGVCVKRSAAYLNWRYRDHYFLRYEVFTARVETALLAYAVVADAGEYAQIVDLFGVEDPLVLNQIVSYIISRCRDLGKIGINVQLLGSRHWVALFNSMGFHIRESFPLLADGSASDGEANPAARTSKWFLTYGDIDG